MSQDQEMTRLIISREDQSLIEGYGLGSLLAIYHAPKKEMRYLTFTGWFASVLSFLALCGLSILAVINWQQILAVSTQHPHTHLTADQLSILQWQLSNEHFSLFRSIAAVGVMFLLGLFILFVRVPMVKRRRVMVCEHGLLHIRQRLKGQRVEMIHWEEIQAIEPVFTWTEQTRLIRKEGKPLALSNSYEYFDELLAQIISKCIRMSCIRIGEAFKDE